MTEQEARAEREALIEIPAEAERVLRAHDDLDALTLIARDVHLYDGGPNQALAGLSARRIAKVAIAAGFSRASQPVQVEVTAAAVQRLREATWAQSGIYPTIEQARTILSAALGGGDHAE